MKNNRLTMVMALLMMALTATFTSCDDDDMGKMVQHTALVTVKPTADSFYLQLNDSVRLEPVNMGVAPYGKREVRALVKYRTEEKLGHLHKVHVTWLDSIRTKMPEPSMGSKNDKVYGHDPIEIVRDWVTVAEDGYLTLRIRMRWGQQHVFHYVSLLTDTNPDNHYVLELRHDANGDTYGMMGDALIAFNLRELMPEPSDKPVKFILRWKSYSGDKQAEFEMNGGLHDVHADLDDCDYLLRVK